MDCTLSTSRWFRGSKKAYGESGYKNDAEIVTESVETAWMLSESAVGTKHYILILKMVVFLEWSYREPYWYTVGFRHLPKREGRRSTPTSSDRM